MLKTINENVIQKIQDFIDSHSYQELLENKKQLLKELFRNMVKCHEISSYAMDYSEKDFRISVTQLNCKEHILYIKE